MKSLEYKNQESNISPENIVSRGDPSVYENIFNKKKAEQDVGSIDALKEKVIENIKISEIKGQINTEEYQKQVQSFVGELPQENGHIDFTKLENVGHGGTHDVFISPNNKGFVAKLNRNALNRMIATEGGIMSPAMRQGADQMVIDENSKHNQLYQYFGEKNCLREKLSIQKIRIEAGDKIKEVETLVSIQEASNLFNNPDNIDLSSSYVEEKLSVETLENYENYREMNESLMGNGLFNEKDFLQFHDKLKPVFELIDNDSGFKEKMQEFLLRFKEYFSASGNFIDLVGEKNVLFYQGEKNWEFQVGSVLKGGTKRDVEEALKTLENEPENLEKNQKERLTLMNGLTLIRLFNATGIKSGIGKIIDIQLSEKQLANLEKVKF